MNFRRLGTSRLEVSEISLGTWLTFGQQPDFGASRACLKAALECGINLFDTADVYADGAAERALGELLGDGPRDAVVIASKCFFPRSDAPADRGLSRRHIFASVERSLRNLRTDRIDLMQCHRFDPDVSLEETVRAMDDLVRDGKIRHWGIGRFSARQTVDVMRVARALGAVAPIANQWVYSFLNREIEPDVLRQCDALGVAILAYSPLAQGVLTGKYAGGRIPGDSRAADERLRRGMWEWRAEQIARVERLRAIAAELDVSIAQLALAWCLRVPGVASAIIGATRPEQVRENVGASGLRLSDDVLARMDPGMRTVRLPLDDEAIEYEVEGETAYGGDEVLLERDDDLIAHTAFAEAGFTVAPFLPETLYRTLVDGVRQLLCAAVKRVWPGHEADFALEGYHRGVTDDEHLQLVRETGLHWAHEELPIPMARVERRISEIIGIDAIAANPFFDRQRFQVRVVRPGKGDNNPPHRDAWLDRLRNAVNVYVPLAGSNERSSLPIVPGSHRWRESEIERTLPGSRVGGVPYTVPAITGARRPLRLVRPPVGPNEVMVFTPYAIHGGGVNSTADTTRVSLEIRFWRRLRERA